MTRILSQAEIEALPESVNRIWQNGRGHTYKTRAAREFEKRLTASLLEARSLSVPYSGEIELKIKIERKARTRFDLDNRIKSIQDCLAPAGVIFDDSQVIKIFAEKIQPSETDRTTVTVLKI